MSTADNSGSLNESSLYESALDNTLLNNSDDGNSSGFSSIYNQADEEHFQNKTKINDDKTLEGNLNSEQKPSGSSDSENTSITCNLSESCEIKIYENLDEFDQNLPETVTLLKTPNGSRVYLVGTAHYSTQSQDDVSLTIRNVQPDVVLIELCPRRIHILKYDEKTLLEEARDINITKIRNIINSNGVVNGIFYILLLNMSAKITKELGMAPGGEFRRALEEARSVPHCTLHLGDRPINITVQRALHGLSTWQSMKLLWRLVTSNEEISKEEVERCKQKDLLEALMKEMTGEYPALGDVFVKERDMYLCNSLQTVSGYHKLETKPVKVVGVVGIGHTVGIKQMWGTIDSSKIPEITVIPPTSRTNKILKFTIKYGTLALVSYGIFRLVRPRFKTIL